MQTHVRVPPPLRRQRLQEEMVHLGPNPACEGPNGLPVGMIPSALCRLLLRVGTDFVFILHGAVCDEKYNWNI